MLARRRMRRRIPPNSAAECRPRCAAMCRFPEVDEEIHARRGDVEQTRSGQSDAAAVDRGNTDRACESAVTRRPRTIIRRPDAVESVSADAGRGIADGDGPCKAQLNVPSTMHSSAGRFRTGLSRRADHREIDAARCLPVDDLRVHRSGLVETAVAERSAQTMPSATAYTPLELRMPENDSTP
ncbi:MAG: hypothetical protein IPH76_01830 [Xanthomonadales bacterium]|nr:hypothetical protein [Xanthomonadales bacterium]